MKDEPPLPEARIRVLAMPQAGGKDWGAPATRAEERAMAQEIVTLRRAVVAETLSPQTDLPNGPYRVIDGVLHRVVDEVPPALRPTQAVVEPAYATCDACGGRFAPDVERCPSCGDQLPTEERQLLDAYKAETERLDRLRTSLPSFEARLSRRLMRRAKDALDEVESILTFVGASSVRCRARFDQYACTLHAGHDGDHADEGGSRSVRFEERQARFSDDEAD